MIKKYDDFFHVLNMVVQQTPGATIFIPPDQRHFKIPIFIRVDCDHFDIRYLATFITLERNSHVEIKVKPVNHETVTLKIEVHYQE